MLKSIIAVSALLASSMAFADKLHDKHTHEHDAKCGHMQVKHGDHSDFLHDGHLHHVGADKKVSEHSLDVSEANPAVCKKPEAMGHDAKHKHGPNCGHAAVPHGDHTDYLVDGVLHHAHDGHCDDHGKIEVVKG